MRRVRSQRGQAAVELVATLPIVALLVLLLWQMAVAGQAAWLVGSAARAASRAQAVGGNAAEAARAVLPASLEHGLRVRARFDGSVSVSLAVPSVVGAGRLTTIGARARFEPQHPRGHA